MPSARKRRKRTKRMRVLPAQLLHQVLHLLHGVPTAYQERGQPASAHGRRKAAELARALHGDGARLEPRIDALLVEGMPDRVLRRATLDALREQVANQSYRSSTAHGPQGRIALGKPPVIEQPAHGQAL